MFSHLPGPPSVGRGSLGLPSAHQEPLPNSPVSDFRRVLSFLWASASLPTQFGDWTSSSTWTAWQRPLELKVEKNSDISWLGCGHQPPHMARDGCPVSSGHQTTLEMRVYTRSLKVWAVMKSSSLEDDLWKTDPKSPHSEASGTLMTLGCRGPCLCLPPRGPQVLFKAAALPAASVFSPHLCPGHD